MLARFAALTASLLVLAACADATVPDAGPTEAGVDASHDLGIDRNFPPPPRDLGPRDLTTDTGGDLGVDAAADMDVDAADMDVDLGPDLGFDAGLLCIPTGAEDCFDGLDNDCNGLFDCADSACLPTAECVPDDPASTLGARVALGGACPTGFGATSTDLHRGLVAPTACSGCSCSAAVDCQTTVHVLGSACPGGAEVATVPIHSFDACDTPLSITTGHVSVDPITTVPMCLQSGSPVVPAATWSGDATFCGITLRGTGCAPGSACVPRAGSHCTLSADPAAVCAAGYTPADDDLWYTALDDTRDCGTTCTCNAPVGGSCSSGTVRLYGSSTCSGSFDGLATGTEGCFLSASITSANVAVFSSTPPSCASSNVLTGTATPTDARRFCCR